MITRSLRLGSILLLISAGGGAGGCRPRLGAAEYNAYLANPAHGLTQTAQIGGATVVCAYRPTDLLVLRDLANQPVGSAAARDSLKRTYAGKTYCTLSLAYKGQEFENQLLTNPPAHERLVNYLSHGIAADVFLAASATDSVAATASFYLQQFGMSKSSTIVLVFNTPQASPPPGFHITVKGQTLGIGTVRFAFAARDLAAIPQLRADKF